MEYKNSKARSLSHVDKSDFIWAFTKNKNVRHKDVPVKYHSKIHFFSILIFEGPIIEWQFLQWTH